jgi:hypothetical protein
MANLLKMAKVADIVTLIKSVHSDRRISAVLLLDRGTVAKYRRQLQAGESPMLSRESAHPKDQSCVTIENPPNAPTGLRLEGSGLPVRTIKPGPPSNCEPYRGEISRKLEQGLTARLDAVGIIKFLNSSANGTVRQTCCGSHGGYATSPYRSSFHCSPLSTPPARRDAAQSQRTSVESVQLE